MARALLCAALTVPVVFATEIPVPRPPAICGLTVVAVGSGAIVLRWEGGTPPFLVLRGDDEDFTAAKDVRLLASDVAAREFRDRAEGGQRYWYQVADRHSPPLLFRTDPRAPHDGDLVTIHGVGFATNCRDNHLILGGQMDAAPLQNCTLTSVQFKVPLHVISDEPMVMTGRGLGRFGSVLEDCEGIPRGAVTWSPGGSSQRGPAAGTLEWALAVEGAREEARKEPETPETLISSYRRLLDLYSRCTACRAKTYHYLKDSLGHYFQDRKAIEQIAEEEYADNEVELVKLLWQTGRAEEARRVALQALERVRLVERRAELQWVLIRIHQHRGETAEARALELRVAREGPVAPDSCPDDPDRSLEMEHLAARLDFSNFRRELEQLQDLAHERRGDAAVACLYNSELVNIRDAVRRGSSAAGLSAPELASLFPEGIEAVQRALASGVSAPDVRAALLLSAAHGKLREPYEPESAVELLKEAEAASRSRRIRVAVLREWLRASWMARRQDDARRLARILTTEFPQYYAACEACQRTANFEATSEWLAACGKLTRDCFDPALGWGQGSNVDLEMLLDGNPPDEAVPAILLMLSDEVRLTDPERSLELEHRAIRHPQFPGLPPGGQERQWRAEQREDFDTALFLALVWSPEELGGSGVPGDKIFRERDFKIAYYKLRLGIDMDAQWRTLLELLNDGPEPERASYFYRVEILDVLVRAAMVAHKESEAVAWLEALRQRYREARRRAGPPAFGSGGPGSLASTLRQMDLVLTGYIGELETAAHQDGLLGAVSFSGSENPCLKPRQPDEK